MSSRITDRDWLSPRLWRSPASRFNNDEPLHAAGVYTAETLATIREQGFDAIWMRGRLRELIRSEVYPELNDARAGERLDSLRQVVALAAELGVYVYLYFNEPLALPRDDPFWARHPEARGEPLSVPSFGWDEAAFCTSAPRFRQFFDESVRNLFADLRGLGGVILITASEYHTHCWSHKPRRRVGDPYIDSWGGPMSCPRCRDREPADVVAELVSIWTENAAAVSPSPQVWAWNWSWSMWYEEPQAEIVRRLPRTARLLLDFERGGMRRQGIGNVPIDEYALGYIGPGERFEGARRAAAASGLPVCAKLQLGVTHELATVPNLPLIPNLFAKLARLDALGVQGIMGSWNFGNSPSLNTAAVRLFATEPALRADSGAFCRALAAQAFPAADSARIAAAWEAFCDAFREYPFSIPMLYHGPINYAVAYPLSLRHHDRPMGPSWIVHAPFGDRLGDCMGPLTAAQVGRCLDLMHRHWRRGLALYGEASEPELACARMIGLHIAAARNIFAFHRRRRAMMEARGLSGPCLLPPDAALVRLMRRHIGILRRAEPLARRHGEFGFHQEPGGAFYTVETIRAAMAAMESELAQSLRCGS